MDWNILPQITRLLSILVNYPHSGLKLNIKCFYKILNIVNYPHSGLKLGLKEALEGNFLVNYPHSGLKLLYALKRLVL